MAEKTEKNEATVIAADTHIKGEMTFERSATIRGRFEGRIGAKGDLRIAESATCAAEVEAKNIVVDGRVEGNLKAAASIELTDKANLKGDIVAARLVTAEGATIQGHVTVGAGQDKAAPKAQPQAQGKPHVRQAQGG